ADGRDAHGRVRTCDFREPEVGAESGGRGRGLHLENDRGALAGAEPALRGKAGDGKAERSPELRDGGPARNEEARVRSRMDPETRGGRVVEPKFAREHVRDLDRLSGRQ